MRYARAVVSTLLRRLPAELVAWYASMALALGIGAFSGAVFAFFLRADMHPPRIVDGVAAGEASVVLEGFRDGALRGRSAGRVRLFVENDAIETDSEGRFGIVHPAFGIEQVSVPVPPGMRFVASKNGKKYYNVDSAAGERIAPQNRVYFADEAAAKAAGFRP